MKKPVLLVFIILFVNFWCFSQLKSPDEIQIEQILNKLSIMWTDPNGLRIANEILAKNVIAVGEQGTLNREEYLKVLAFVFKNSGVVKNTHEIHMMKIFGNTAYEHGTIILKLKNGSEQRMETMNVFIKEEGQWKYYGSLMGDVIKEIF
jgi:hypothetical protein